MLKVVIFVSFLLVIIYAQESVLELGNICNTTLDYKLNNLYQIDNTLNESFPNPCNFSINASRNQMDGFIVRVDFKYQTNFSLINISDKKKDSSNHTKILIGSNKTNDTNQAFIVLSNYFQISLKDLSKNNTNFTYIERIAFTSFNYTNC